jgi:hypothetical protein
VCCCCFLHGCRNFLGFTREIFTDAGKYVVHFGYAPNTAAEMAEKTIAIRSGKSDVHVTPLAQMRTEVAVIPSVTGNQLVGVAGVCGCDRVCVCGQGAWTSWVVHGAR